MDNVKLSLTVILPGSKMVTDDSRKELVQMRINRDILNISIKGTEDAKQVINMSKDAYDYMVSNEMPEWFHNKFKWNTMSKKQRLIEHLQRTCDHLRGKSYSYTIYED